VTANAKKLPKYLIIKRTLMDRIARKQYSGKIAVPPEKELAGELGAAPMTVRRAIQELVGEGLLVRQRGRGKGTFVCDVRGVPHAARSDGSQLKRVGVLHRQSMNELRESPVYFLIYMEIQAECARNGVALEFLPDGTEERRSATSIKRMAADSGVQALLVLDWWNPTDLLEVQESGLPVIVPGSFQETIPVSCVVGNEYQGAFAATRHLQELGHKTVALVNSRKEIKTTVDRRGGWIAAADMTFEDAEKISYRAGRKGLRSGQTFAEIKDDLVKQFKKRPPPSAIFARDGYFAYAVIAALRELERSCPGDISIACVGSSYEKVLDMPRMTSAEINDGALGRAVVRLAQDLVSGRQDSAVQIALPMHVTEGESVRAAK
jgi:DNA-binding LacI/PurR family transcriptional regulator